MVTIHRNYIYSLFQAYYYIRGTFQFLLILIVSQLAAVVSYDFNLTETGGICITPRPSDPGAVIKPGMPMRPFLGIKPALLDSKQVP